MQNLEKNITTRELHDTFADFGEILSCKVAVDKEGKSKGYGFVHFAEPTAAKRAIEDVNGAQLGESDKVVTVTEFVSKQERGDPKQTFTNVYVKNLPSSITTEEEVKTMFGEYGEISSVALMKVCSDVMLLHVGLSEANKTIPLLLIHITANELCRCLLMKSQASSSRS